MIRAYLDMIVVQPLDGETETNSGLILPPWYDEKLRRGMVISVGERVPALQTGQVIYFKDDCCLKVRDAMIVHAGCVVAYEEDE